MLAACSSEDTALNNTPAQEGQKVPFTATIAAPGGNAGTRTEYTEVTTGSAAGTINVVWKAGDEIALIHNGKADVVKVHHRRHHCRHQRRGRNRLLSCCSDRTE